MSARRFDHGYSWVAAESSLISEMDRMSEEGWELVSACVSENGGTTLFWKRPAQEVGAPA